MLINVREYRRGNKHVQYRETGISADDAEMLLLMKGETFGKV